MHDPRHLSRAGLESLQRHVARLHDIDGAHWSPEVRRDMTVALQRARVAQRGVDLPTHRRLADAELREHLETLRRRKSHYLAERHRQSF